MRLSNSYPFPPIRLFVVFIFGCLTILQPYDSRAMSCDDIFSRHQLQSIEFQLAQLPQPGSQEFIQLVQKAREQLNQNRHYAKIDLNDWLTASFRDELFRLYSKTLKWSDSFYSIDNASLEASRAQAIFNQYRDWLNILVDEILQLNSAYPHYQVSSRYDFVPQNNIRISNPNVRPHFDSGLFNTVLTLVGPGTRVLKTPFEGGPRHEFDDGIILRQEDYNKNDYVSLLPGELLILAGRDQSVYYPPLHWRPKLEGDRLTWIVQFFSRNR